MANVIPLAGLGSRYSKDNYNKPKPLITISGEPMIIQAIRHMPPSNKWIFIVRQEHIKEYQIDEIIKKEISTAIIIAVNETTLGQANTCLLAQGYLLPDEPLFISACDNGYIYDEEKYLKLVEDPNIDSIVLTFTQMEKMRINPQAYGWAILDEDNVTIKDMSVKTKISKDPYYDHAVVSTFYFKKAQDFIDSVNLMIKKNYRINGEFYVDAVPIFMKQLNKKSIIFDINQWASWGTPAELKKYEYWENVFIENKKFDEQIHNSKEYSSWKNYFENKKKLK